MIYHRVSVAAALMAPSLAVPATAQTCTGTQTVDAVRLSVEAVGLRNGKGQVAFTVYANDRIRFMAKGGKLLRTRVKAIAPVTRACFWLPPGLYELAQYHDENGDQDFNRTLFVPKEGFGFSNDASTTLGLPSMQAAQFTLPRGGTTVRMKMRYRR